MLRGLPNAVKCHSAKAKGAKGQSREGGGKNAWGGGKGGLLLAFSLNHGPDDDDDEGGLVGNRP